MGPGINNSVLKELCMCGGCLSAEAMKCRMSYRDSERKSVIWGTRPHLWKGVIMWHPSMFPFAG